MGSPGPALFCYQIEPDALSHRMTTDTRLISETGLARRIGAIAEPVLRDLGYELVRVRVSGQNGCTVQIMAERPDGSMTIDDCALVSQSLSPLLDVEDPVEGDYHLEISSPGIDRPLVRLRDFQRWSGSEAKIELTQLLDGRKRFRGVIAGVTEAGVLLDMDGGGDEPTRAELPFELIAEARLVLTDALIEDSLKAQKKAARNAASASIENS